MTAISSLDALRLAEIEAVRALFVPGSRLLELGGADGFQASILASWGLDVESLDVSWRRKGTPSFPVRDYDGGVLPYPDASFDYVFSSNVLEHIPDLSLTLRECLRVARPGATFIHLLPSTSWRWWTNLTHYPYLFGRYVLRRPDPRQAHVQPATMGEGMRKRGVFRLVRRALMAAPHGVYPNALSELWYFSAARWRRVFREHGYEVTDVRKAGVFYTGYGVLRDRLPIAARRRIAPLAGSGCNVFVLRMAAPR